jgi:hypothetical protein
MLTERQETGSHKGSRPNIKITNQIDFDEKLIFSINMPPKFPNWGCSTESFFLKIETANNQ